MSDELDGANDNDNDNDNEVHRDGLAMLAILLLTIALIVYVGWNLI